MPAPVRRTKSDVAATRRVAVRRFSLVIAIFVLWMGGIGARLIYLQSAQGEFWREKALDQRRRERKTRPLRGAILDRNGRELAITLEVESLWADPIDIEDPASTAYQLAKVLGEKPAPLLEQINTAKAARRRFIWLARELDREQVERVRNLGLAGVQWRKEQKRFYPHGTLAAHILGYSNRDDIGQAGIEMSQDKILRGEVIESIEERDAGGRILSFSEKVVEPPRNVQLTIDYSIQHQTEQALAAGVEAARAKSGSAIVLDPRTGEVLAMATVPTFNPNQVGTTKPEVLTNRAVQNLYEPGSTFKLVPYSAALDQGAATPVENINTGAGFIKVGKRIMQDAHAAKNMTVTEGFARSSNFVAITMGLRAGKNRFYEYGHNFGYGEATGIELPAETKGRFATPDRWSEESIGTTSIGYEVGATLLQTAAAYAAIANDGVRMKPHLVKEIQAEDNSVLTRTELQERRVVSQGTAAAMRQMMHQVTVRGTARRAQLKGYTVGGKTGTAHKYDHERRRYAKERVVASFVGFAPAERPAAVIAVVIDEPGAAKHGGEVAAPIFASIAAEVLPEMRIAPDALEEPSSQVLTAQNTDADDAVQGANISANETAVMPTNPVVELTAPTNVQTVKPMREPGDRRDSNDKNNQPPRDDQNKQKAIVTSQTAAESKAPINVGTPPKPERAAEKSKKTPDKPLPPARNKPPNVKPTLTRNETAVKNYLKVKNKT